jgi:uncharacterized SAM-binding protein YcdF (DUF218 family)
VNELLLHFGLSDWKPLLTALLLPPVPPLLCMLLGAALLRRRTATGWLLLLAGAAGIWLGSTVAAGRWLQQRLLHPPPALGAADLQQLSARRTGAAIVVLGAGREAHAPEFDAPNLSGPAMERLRYGLWLARQTGLPLAFSGGTGHAQDRGPPEAEVAAALAARDYGQPLKWTESRSRDTRENAAASVALLRLAGVTRIVLVTHGWHMRRSLRAFEQAIARSGGGIVLQAAPMGLAPDGSTALLRWLPSPAGFTDTYRALREALGLLAGA